MHIPFMFALCNFFEKELFQHCWTISSSCLFPQAVRLESAYPQVTRYMVVVSTNGRQDTEESIVLGVDFVSSDGSVRGLKTQRIPHASLTFVSSLLSGTRPRLASIPMFSIFSCLTCRSSPPQLHGGPGPAALE